VQMWREGFPDFHFKLEDMIVQGNKIVLRIPFTGTHLGKFWGLEPTGKKINVTETLILRLDDERIAEMWEDYDEYGMRIQLGGETKLKGPLPLLFGRSSTPFETR
jgi:predicted ester cyclase